MPYYRIRGKWYHLEYSDLFNEVIEARSPRSAIITFALDHTGEEQVRKISWDMPLARKIQMGALEPEPAFWVGDDQLYSIRSVTRVVPREVVCPTCEGRGRTQGFVDLSSNEKLTLL